MYIVHTHLILFIVKYSSTFSLHLIAFAKTNRQNKAGTVCPDLQKLADVFGIEN